MGCASRTPPWWPRRCFPTATFRIASCRGVVLLLEVAPGFQNLAGGGVRVVGGGKGAVGVFGGAEMGQHAGAIQPLPPEGVVGQAVVLAPADFDGEEV